MTREPALSVSDERGPFSIPCIGKLGLQGDLRVQKAAQQHGIAALSGMLFIRRPARRHNSCMARSGWLTTAKYMSFACTAC